MTKPRYRMKFCKDWEFMVVNMMAKNACGRLRIERSNAPDFTYAYWWVFIKLN